MVAALLAGLGDLVLVAVEVDHLVQQCRAGLLLGPVDELGAQVDLIHALGLGLPNLLGGAVAVGLRRSLDGDHGLGQLALEVDRVELVEDVLQGRDGLAHLHGVGGIVLGAILGLLVGLGLVSRLALRLLLGSVAGLSRLTALVVAQQVVGLVGRGLVLGSGGRGLLVDGPAAVVGGGGHDGGLGVELVGGHGENLAVLLVDLDDLTDLLGLLVDDLLVGDNGHVLHFVFLLIM